MPIPEHLLTLSAEQVQDVINDLMLLAKGYELHLCVEPHELFDFCFPVNPDVIGKVNLDHVADDQAALHEAFFNWPTKPLLLPDYAVEIDGILNYFEFVIGGVYSRADLIQAIIREDRFDLPAVERTDTMKLLEQHFNVVLAVCMGIYSIGMERLRDVLRTRLQREPENPALARLWVQADNPMLAGVIERNLFATLDRLSSIDAKERERRKNSATVDAKAIARVMRLNQLCREAPYQRKHRKRLFLYLSSSPRTDQVFKLAPVQRQLPRIDGKPYRIWRSRAQIFIYLLHKGNAGRAPLWEDISDLERLQGVIAKRGRQPFGTQCQRCILDGGHGEQNCRFLALCEIIDDLEENISEARRSIANLRLVGAVRDFDQLLDALPKTSEEQEYLEFFRGLFSSASLQDVVLNRIRELQQMLFIKQEFSDTTASLYERGRELQRRGHRDPVTNAAQALPGYLHLTSAAHRDIVADVMAFHKSPDLKHSELLLGPYKRFVELERENWRINSDHELVRCFLYMACIGGDGGGTGVEGNSIAFRHGQKMLRLHKESQREFWYLMGWALRREGKYRDADRLLTLAIRRFPQDARFYHGRSINAFGWSRSKEGDRYPFTILRPIRDAQKAVVLYQAEGNAAAELVAVNWNNIAYLRSLHDAGSHGDLSMARKALMELKQTLPRANWAPSHPEFFHTEANLEYLEYVAATKKARRRIDLIDKLANAKWAIGQAIAIDPKPEYVALQFEIDKALERETARRESEDKKSRVRRSRASRS